MATAASNLVPAPPGAPTQGIPQSSQAASPSPPQPNPRLDAAMKMVLQIVSGARALAKMFPAAAPFAQDINDSVQRIQQAVMQDTEPGEPAAPPVNG